MQYADGFIRRLVRTLAAAFERPTYRNPNATDAEKAADLGIGKCFSILLYHLLRILLSIAFLYSIYPSNITHPTLSPDTSMAGAALSTIFALTKRTDVVDSMRTECTLEVLRECLLRICDERMVAPKTTEQEASSTAAQILRAFNMIVLKITQNGDVSDILCILLQLIFHCIPHSEVILNYNILKRIDQIN